MSRHANFKALAEGLHFVAKTLEVLDGMRRRDDKRRIEALEKRVKELEAKSGRGGP